MAISLIASTRGVALLPVYALNFLPWSVTSRPLRGEAPTIDLVLGYHKANTSSLLRLFLSKADEMVDRVAGRPGDPHPRRPSSIAARPRRRPIAPPCGANDALARPEAAHAPPAMASPDREG